MNLCMAKTTCSDNRCLDNRSSDNRGWTIALMLLCSIYCLIRTCLLLHSHLVLTSTFCAYIHKYVLTSTFCAYIHILCLHPHFVLTLTYTYCILPIYPKSTFRVYIYRQDTRNTLGSRQRYMLHCTALRIAWSRGNVPSC